MAEGSQDVTNDTVLALIALVAGFAVGLVVAWLYWMQRERPPEPSRSKIVEGERVPLEPPPAVPEEPCRQAEDTAESEPTPAPEPEPKTEPDDLTRIEGIGPKMSSVLAEAGTVTFEQLAEHDPEALKEMLRAEGLQFADPTTWPEQAALAAAGAWEALDELQGELSGGRRVG
jgi:predicted flap endonuclease-1-like 5' DNA nuclease